MKNTSTVASTFLFSQLKKYLFTTLIWRSKNDAYPQQGSILPKTKHWLVTLGLLCFLPVSILTQNTWTGNADANWDNDNNWNTGAKPTLADDVIIPEVLTNYPEIRNLTNALARSVVVQANAEFNILSGGKLTITGSAADGLANNGSVNNDGSIEVDGPGGINSSSYAAILNTYIGTFINKGTINIGAMTGIGREGLQNEGVFSNVAGGEINIDNSGEYGIHNIDEGIFTNKADINIGAKANVGDFGILNFATFNNDINGQINIDRSERRALQNHSVFINKAIINIGAKASVGNVGIRSRSGGNFSNEIGGQINIDNATENGILVTDGSFTNKATIKIGFNTSIGLEAILNEATFINQGALLIENAGTSVLTNNGGTFDNTGGLFKADGTIGGVTELSGTIAPGTTSIGEITSLNDIDLSAATIQIEVDGNSNSLIDQFKANGAVILGGTLDISIDYNSADDERLVFLTATSISGTFNLSNPLPTAWELDYAVPGEVALVSAMGFPNGFEATDIECEDGAEATYDPEEESYTLTANDCAGYPQGEYSLVKTELCGDGEIIARTASLSGEGRAGLIMMENADNGARFVSIIKDLTRRTRTEYRSATDGSISYKSKNRPRVEWLKIVRDGSKFKTYTSTNGYSWRLAHIINFPNFENCIQVGMLAYTKTSYEPVTATATFDNVKISGDNYNALTQLPSGPATTADNTAQVITADLQNSIGLNVAPNPFATQTQIAFHLARAAEISLEIYNLHGQRVQSLESAQLDAGAHRYQWDGNSSKGESLPTGIYLLRLRVDKKWITAKVSLVNR